MTRRRSKLGGKRRGASQKKRTPRCQKKKKQAAKRRAHRTYSKKRAAFDKRQAKVAGLTLRGYTKRRRDADRRHRQMVAEISQEAMIEMLMGKRPMAPKLRDYLRGHVDIDPSMVEYTTKKGYGF